MDLLKVSGFVRCTFFTFVPVHEHCSSNPVVHSISATDNCKSLCFNMKIPLFLSNSSSDVINYVSFNSLMVTCRRHAGGT